MAWVYPIEDTVNPHKYLFIKWGHIEDQGRFELIDLYIEN